MLIVVVNKEKGSYRKKKRGRLNVNKFGDYFNQFITLI